MIVNKFGGTSVADASAWKQVFSILKHQAPSVVVVSATSKTTNDLLSAADLAQQGKLEEAKKVTQRIKKRHLDIIDELIVDKKMYQEKVELCTSWVEEHCTTLDHFLLGISTLRELTPRSLDAISSLGERMSSFLIGTLGPLFGVNSTYVFAGDVLKTNSTFGKALPNLSLLNESVKTLRESVHQGMTPIVGGFFGTNDKGEITTLGRGGSDYSAALFAAALDATEVLIWTDVSGMFTSDPRFVEGTTPLKEISYKEAAELAYFGAKVLHPATIQPAVEKSIPVWIKNTFRPEEHGTKIFVDAPLESTLRAIAFKKNITIVTVTSSRMLLAYGFLAKVFSIFEQNEVSVDLVSTSEVSISMSVDSVDKLDQVTSQLASIGEVSVRQNKALICVVGKRFLKSTGIAGRIFKAIENYAVQLISQGSSDINLSFVVDNDEALEVVQVLHNEFFPQ